MTKDPAWLQESDERAKAATPGKWLVFRRTSVSGKVWVIESPEAGQIFTLGEGNREHIAANNPDHVLKLNALIREMADTLETIWVETGLAASTDAIWKSELARKALARFQEGP